ncbi:MAG: hypothetical protein ACTHL8_01650 [Burkholderiaceae bacterium]
MQEILRSAHALVLDAVDCLALARTRTRTRTASDDDDVDAASLDEAASLLRQALCRMAAVLPADARPPRRLLMDSLMLEVGPPPAAAPDGPITLRWPEDALAAPPLARRPAGVGRSSRPV